MGFLGGGTRLKYHTTMYRLVTVLLGTHHLQVVPANPLQEITVGEPR